MKKLLIIVLIGLILTAGIIEAATDTGIVGIGFSLVKGEISVSDTINLTFTLIKDFVDSATSSLGVTFTLIQSEITSITDSISVSFTLLAEGIISAFDSILVSLTLIKTEAPEINCTVETLSVINHGTNNATLRGNLIDLNTSSATVWFEYGRVSGCYHYRTPNQTMSNTGIFTEDVKGIWLIPNQTYHYRTCVVCSPAQYGDELNFTLNPLEREIENRNFSDEYETIRGDELNMSKLAEAIPTVYTGLMGNVFFGILFGAIFIAYFIRQEDVTLPSLLGMVIGGSILFLLPPSWKHMAYIMLVISFAGIMYGILKARK